MIHKVALALCALALVVTSCGSSAPQALPSDVQVTVDLKDSPYSVVVSPATFKAGTITFGIRNTGAMPHQFDLIKTDLAADKLPIDAATAKAKEDGLVKQVLNIQPGKVATVSAELQPGHYVIICNVAGHYQLGMRADFTVQ